MKWINMLRQYKIYRSIAVALVVVLAVTTLSLALLLYGAFSGDMQAELGRMAASSMAQVAFVVSDLQARTTALTRQLIGDANVVATMFKPKAPPLEVYRASRMMHLSRSVNPYVHCILVANGGSNRVYATCDLRPEDERLLFNQISSSYILQAGPVMQLSLVSAAGGREKVLGFTGYSELSTDEADFGAIVVGIRPDYIASLMRKVNTGDSGAIMMLDGEGTALTHSDARLVFENLSQQPHLRRALDDGGAGYAVTEVDGELCLVAYAPVERMGWMAVSVQPYAALQRRMNRLLMVTALASLALLMGGALLAMYATARAYRPVARTLASSGFRAGRTASEADYIDRRFRRGEELESDARAVGPLVRDALLLQLLTDWQSSVEQSALKQMGVELCGPYYLVCMLSLDGVDATSEAAALLVDGPRALLGADGIAADAVFVDRRDVALLMQLPTDTVPDRLPILFGELQSELTARCGATLSCATGAIVTDVDALPESYHVAMEKLAYRFFEGDGCLLLGEDYRAGHSAYLTFPQEKETRLRMAVQDGIPQALESAFAPCVAHMRALTPEGAVLFAHQLIISMLRKLPSLIASGELQSRYMRALEEIRECRLAEQVCSVLRETLSSMAKLERKAPQAAELDPQVTQMLNCIHRQYTDPSISLETVSSGMNRSSAYLGRLFRTQVGRSFSESLGLYRTERAAELLISTNDTLAAICERVGIANSNYFYTQFKKIYGCTPQTYRGHMAAK